MFFRNIEPWECSLLFPWFQCVEQKAGAPVWLRLICGPRATSLAVCTIVVLLCRVCTSLLCVCTSLCHDCTSLWRVCTSLCPDCTSVTTSLDDLLDTHLSIVFSSDAEYPMPFRNLVNSTSSDTLLKHLVRQCTRASYDTTSGEQRRFSAHLQQWVSNQRNACSL